MIHNVWILYLSSLEVIVRHNLKDKAKNPSKELGCVLVVGADLGWVYLLINEVNNVHL